MIPPTDSHFELTTFGHATLVVSENGKPLVATDPWLFGSAYWRSWWLERPPSEAQIRLVHDACHVYITHGHPDHFHWPSLRRIGPRSILSPRLPDYPIPAFLREHGYSCEILEPFRYYQVTSSVRICSVPVLVDDSILIVETPNAYLVDLNDCFVTRGYLALIRHRCLDAGKVVIALKSYSPASSRATTYRDGVRMPLKSKQDYVRIAQKMAGALGAQYFVPFASQAFFNRSDSRWANEHKVTYDDLADYWSSENIVLCKPFVTMDLDSFEWSSNHSAGLRCLEARETERLRAREEEERRFQPPEDLDERLCSYLNDVALLRILFRRGIGFRLTSSGKERFYDARERNLRYSIPAEHDLIISIPDKVLYDALCSGIVTDLGIALFVRIDTRVGVRRTHMLFPLFGLHDYGHTASLRSFGRFISAYLRCAAAAFRSRDSSPAWVRRHDLQATSSNNRTVPVKTPVSPACQSRTPVR